MPIAVNSGRSEIAVNLVDTTGKEKPCAVIVDNTFNGMNCFPIEKSLAVWEKDIGKGSQVSLYNRIAHGSKNSAAINGLQVGTVAQRRIDSLVSQWLLRQ